MNLQLFFRGKKDKLAYLNEAPTLLSPVPHPFKTVRESSRTNKTVLLS
jgi:hypothetical protein